MSGKPIPEEAVARVCDRMLTAAIGKDWRKRAPEAVTAFWMGEVREALQEVVPALTAAQQQGQAVAFEGTDREVLREFIRMCREDKPVGQWPGERVCAAIERSMANERPFRFIAEADMAPEREPSMKDADRALSGPRRNTAPPPSVPVVDEAMTRRIMADFHANDPGDVWPPDEQGRLRRQALQDAINKHLAAAPALAQQPAAVGEEIMVNAAHDVFTLPLQPSGLSSGPRFVVHVPAPEQQPAAPSGEVRNAILDALNLVHAEGRAGVESATAEMADRLAALAQQPAAVDRARFRKAPCYRCGYNGPGYFQPETHPCAALYHATQHQEPST